jgi:LPS sulfotransferase NodH
MLCRGLTDTGLAGHPEEYFLAEDRERLPDWRFWEEGPYGVEYGARDREHYLELVFQHGTTDNGVFGAKLQWNNLRWAIEKFQELPRFAGFARAEVLHRAFPGLHVVHLLRRNRVRQAISWARMAQGSPWVVSDDEPAQTVVAEPRYDFQLIAGMERQIAEGERDWRRLFDELGLRPLVLYYEGIATEDGYEEAVRRVLCHVGIQLPDDFVVPSRRTHQQADTLTAEWEQRFHADRAAQLD